MGNFHLQKLSDVLGKAVSKYNKFRSSEVIAKILSVDEKLFEIEFNGPFCRTCGFYDYFEDMKVLLEDFALRVKITRIKEIFEGAVVRFEVLE